MEIWVVALATACALVAVHGVAAHFRRIHERKSILPSSQERIVILGASSVNGIGAAIARQCLARGAYNIMLVGRRSDALREVKLALISGLESEAAKARAQNIELFVADCTDEEDVLRLASAIVQDFGGIDTLYVVFGAICTQPLLSMAGLDPLCDPDAKEPTLGGLRATSNAMQQSNAANITSTALILTALIPALQTNSKAPYVAVIGSLASLVPAPTRGLYCATKAAQQMLVLSTAAECASQARVAGRALVKFVVMAPSTVATFFSTRLAIGVPADQKQAPRSTGRMLSAHDVGETVVRCVERGVTGVVPMPYRFFFVWLLSPLLPSLVERGAHRRYGY